MHSPLSYRKPTHLESFQFSLDQRRLLKVYAMLFAPDPTPNASYHTPYLALRSSRPSVSSSLPTRLLPRQPRPFSRPSLAPHALLDAPPDALDNLSIPPPPLLTASPLIDLRTQHTSSEILDTLRCILALPSDINTRVMTEQLRGIGVLVALELPCLACCEDGHDARPVSGFEGGCAVDEDECDRLGGDGRHQAPDLYHVCTGGVGGVGRHENAFVEEGFYVAGT